ncbi:MAG TPA: DNA methyltransferase [Candidatus Saccharimonadales bacterium]|nr:DNA methyltransferase [Candidatus Saccharimonadales bacterium]
MVYKSLFVLGRQPAIGRAELESLFGSAHVAVAGENAVLSDLAPANIPFERLGGTVKLARVVTTIAKNDWRTLQAELTRAALQLAEDTLEGKIQLGLSMYGIHTSPRQLVAAGLEIKKHLRGRGYSVRLVPNKEQALSSAQVLHNHLTEERGIELLAASAGNKVIIARSTRVQDINAYAARDQNRPKRDAFVGMLPPKLAQTIVNLATAAAAPNEDTVVLDPFCGTGVVLQEALLMGYGGYGTDLEPRMIDFSRQNLEWLATRDRVASPRLEVGDATSYHWHSPFATVASETYLGHPLGSWPSNSALQQIIGTCNVIIEKHLRNLATQAPRGLRACLAVPAWRDPNGKLHHLPLLDHLDDMGYNRVSFEHARWQEMVYFRPDQLVARELLVIVRNEHVTR